MTWTNFWGATALLQAAEGGGFILYGADSPPENVHTSVEAGKRFGTYPIRS